MIFYFDYKQRPSHDISASQIRYIVDLDKGITLAFEWADGAGRNLLRLQAWLSVVQKMSVGMIQLGILEYSQVNF